MAASRVEIVAEGLIAYIKDNHYTVGSKLPTEAALKAHFEVGNGTLREAIRMLVSRNILEVRQGSGIYVSEKRGIAEDPLGLELIEEKETLGVDLLDVRLMIEPELAALAALHHTQEALEQLRRCEEKIRACVTAGEDHSAGDIEFHTLLARCSGNSVVDRLVPVINSAIYAAIDLTQNSHSVDTLKEHEAILDAIAQKDPTGARAAMIAHLSTNRQLILKRNPQKK